MSGEASDPTVALLRGEPRPAPASLRRRSAFISLILGLLFLAGLLAWGLGSTSDDRRTVLLVVPDGARLSLDDEPVPATSEGGTHLLRLEPDTYRLGVRLRNGTELEEELRVADDEGVLSLELRHERGQGRWRLVEVGTKEDAR